MGLYDDEVRIGWGDMIFEEGGWEKIGVTVYLLPGPVSLVLEYLKPVMC